MRQSALFPLLAVGVAALAAQLLTVERVNPTPPVSLANGDKAAPAQVEALLTRACYDCHANQTRCPWHSLDAPMASLVPLHVAFGRKELDFTEPGSHYPQA